MTEVQSHLPPAPSPKSRKALWWTRAVTGAALLGVGYWWFFMGWGQLTDENLQKLKPGMSPPEVHAILGNPNRYDDNWETRRRSVSVKYSGYGDNRRLKTFSFSDY